VFVPEGMTVLRIWCLLKLRTECQGINERHGSFIQSDSITEGKQDQSQGIV